MVMGSFAIVTLSEEDLHGKERRLGQVVREQVHVGRERERRRVVPKVLLHLAGAVSKPCDSGMRRIYQTISKQRKGRARERAIGHCEKSVAVAAVYDRRDLEAE